MDFMSDDFASFCPVMDLSTGNNTSSNNNNKNSSPSPSNGEDASSEAGGNYISLRSDSAQNSSNFTTEETFHLLDAVNNHLGELTNPKLKKYRIWVRIAEDINKLCDSKFNGGQCSSKFRNLKCHFGKLQAQFKATGDLKITWPFYNQMLSIFPDEASYNWMNSVVSNGDNKQEMEDEEEVEEDEDYESSNRSASTRPRGGHTAGFTTNSAGELVPCFTLKESMTLLDVVRKHIAELKDPRTCKGKIWAKVAAEVNKKCGCAHTGAQCSARYRNLKCRFLKRKQKGTDMTWTFGAKLASVLEAENEVKVEMAAAGENSHQLSSLLAYNTNGTKEDTTPLKSDYNNLKSTNQSQPLNLEQRSASRNSTSSTVSHQLHHQQIRRRSRISTGPRPRVPVSSAKELLASGQVNLVSHNNQQQQDQSTPTPTPTPNAASSSSDCFTASETVTLLDLVAKYLKDLNSPAESGMRRHDIWTRIAAELNDAYGTRYTSTQCSARFRNLKCRFIKTQEYNRVTGSDKKVAFNDNIARLFAAEAAINESSQSGAVVNGSTTGGADSSGSEQVSPINLNNGRPKVTTYSSPPTPSFTNGSRNKTSNRSLNGTVSPFENSPQQQQPQVAHSSRFALPQPMVSSRPQSHLSLQNPAQSPSYNRSQVENGVDLSSSQTNHDGRPVGKVGRDSVVEQLRVMHEDWVHVTERRHQEIMSVLRQLAANFPGAAPVGLVDNCTAAALVMCRPPVEAAEELLAAEDEDEEMMDDEEVKNETTMEASYEEDDVEDVELEPPGIKPECLDEGGPSELSSPCGAD